VVAALVLAAACSQGGGSAAPPTTAATGPPFAVGTRLATFVDAGRPTPANGDFPGAPTRTLPVRFWYPAAGPSTGAPAEDAGPARTAGPFPLVVFSHGYTGTPEAYGALLAAVASRGYVVAAPRYPLSSQGAPGSPTIADLANQPGDVSFVIGRVVAAATAPEGWLAGLVDASRIAVAGHSLGAMTTYAVAYNSCCRDRRVDAAVVLAGFAGGFEGSWFDGPPVPLLAIHGDQDRTVAYALGVSAFEDAKPPKYLVTIVGGNHSDDMHGGATPGQRMVAAAIADFLDAYLRGDRRARARLHADAERPGLSHLRADESAVPPDA
jgi:dienelactone hydrolase